MIEEVSPNEVNKERYKPELQSRVKIDRFTGGAMDGALFDSMPIYRPKDGEKTLNSNRN